MKENRMKSSHRKKKRRSEREGRRDRGGEKMQKGHKAGREKNNESAERQERFSGNIFQENEESNITQRKRVIWKLEWV